MFRCHSRGDASAMHRRCPRWTCRRHPQGHGRSSTGTGARDVARENIHPGSGGPVVASSPTRIWAPEPTSEPLGLTACISSAYLFVADRDNGDPREPDWGPGAGVRGVGPPGALAGSCRSPDPRASFFFREEVTGITARRRMTGGAVGGEPARRAPERANDAQRRFRRRPSGASSPASAHPTIACPT